MKKLPSWQKVTRKIRSLKEFSGKLIQGQDNPEIKKQKDLAKNFLDRLRVIDPAACVAGGAPRDWWLGKPAKDIDFYVRSVAGDIYNLGSYAKRLSMLLGETVTVKEGVSLGDDKDGNNYHGMKELLHVFEFQHDGQEFDIMFIRQGVYPEKAVYGFDASICKIAWRPDIFLLTDAFSNTIKTNTITYGVNAKEDGKHPKKMREKFPEFRHVFQKKKKDKKSDVKISVQDVFIADQTKYSY